MLRRFAENISPSREWCTYWEINRHNLPAPVDYASDSDFWYNLPANFDVLDCCYRQYHWTGDRTYIDHPAFRNFYERTVGEYVRAWDKDGDGIPEHYPSYGNRGIASYNEEVPDIRVGADLIALQYAAYQACASILELNRDADTASELRMKARHLSEVYDREWWREEQQCFAGSLRENGSYDAGQFGCTVCIPLIVGLSQDERRTNAALEHEIRCRSRLGAEERSYMPELLYAYDRDDLAFSELLVLTDPGYHRREYPEVSFAVIGAVAAGLMGIAPDATARTIATRSHLTADAGWVELDNVPAFDNLIRIRHHGKTETIVANLSGSEFRWRAAFPGQFDELILNGVSVAAESGRTSRGTEESWCVLSCLPGDVHVVAAPTRS